ncbi:hypothetical protein D9753_26390 [Streptomyces dangxiongensis]|uniref:Small hydrophilic protein n=1 Tax=Streptomyces dangxiongensis TaxID=1442032 RepID=A0A3G2JHD4_9ACTN|nr:hypothetical protein [Streptomyces dangxiongensis]AYN41820.1 hypothetical protein D9753_26390 [Streptomyces dangxiongensis]
MAKNKNRKQGGPQNRAPQAEQAHERTHRPPAEEQESSMAGIPGSPADVARKQQKRFGHN